MYNILICDDDRDIVSALDIYLTSEGYKTFPAYDGRQALTVMEENDIHLILMDIMMPNLDGIRATAKLRESYNVPIILLTAKSEDADKVLGLNIGADDYITKPFNPMEVMARVKSQLRRYTTLGGRGGVVPEEDGTLKNGGIVMDDNAKLVTVDGEEVNLTPIEFNILNLFLRHPGQVFSTAQIYEQVWHDQAYGAENTVAVHIRHLREKIEIDPANPRYIKVVWGLGYKMEKNLGCRAAGCGRAWTGATAQPLAALPPYGCGVPLAGVASAGPQGGP